MRVVCIDAVIVVTGSVLTTHERNPTANFRILTTVTVKVSLLIFMSSDLAIGKKRCSVNGKYLIYTSQAIAIAMY